MNKIKLAVIGAAAFMLAAVSVPVQAADYVPIQGIYIDGSTNKMNIGGTNLMVSRLEESHDIYYNLDLTPSSQSDTNKMPAVPLCNRGLSGRYLALTITMKAAAADTTDVTFYFAGKSGGASTNWDTSFRSIAIPPTGTTEKTVVTNIDCMGTPFVALYRVVNGSASVQITNLQVSASFKPGI